MNDSGRLDQRIETMAWGALLLWLGVIGIVPGLPSGAGLLGTGAIVLALNLVRRICALRVNRFTTILGAIAILGGGALFVVREVLGVASPELPVFPTLLAVAGVVVLVLGITRGQSAEIRPEGESH